MLEPISPATLSKALTIIKSFEGLRLKAYQDIGGRWTIGYGSTGPGIEPGVTWTEIEALQRLQQDVQTFIQGVMNLIKVPISDNQLAALTSFAYNLGLPDLKRSGLLRLLNQGKYREASDQFLLWDKVGSYTSDGLAKRRRAERTLFLS